MKKTLFIISAFMACFDYAVAQSTITFGTKTYLASDIDNISYTEYEINNTIIDEINADPSLSIFAEALRKTALCDSVVGYDPYLKQTTYSLEDNTDRDGYKLYYPKTKTQKYTIFIEDNATLAKYGINSFDDLVAKCKDWYGKANDWYDYINEKGKAISTGNDYTNRFNVVNMFVAYHMLKVGMPIDKILYERNSNTMATWNYCFGYEPQAYFETMLPNTLVKAWELNPKSTHDIFLNRYRKNNTLTDQIATFGSDETHPVIYEGSNVDRNRSLESFNGYVHRVDKPLLYDQNAKDALCERMRFNISTMLPEMINEGLRFTDAKTISSTLNNGGNGYRVAFPTDYFDNLKCYDNRTVLRYNVMGAWRALESDQFQGWGPCDFAIKLPHVPTGTYELRIIYPPMQRGGQIQYYVGPSSDKALMQAIGIPLDATLNPYERGEVIGFEPITYGNGYGFYSDITMKNHGYMRAPASFSRGSYNMITDRLTYDASDSFAAARVMADNPSCCCRTEEGYGTMILRRVIGTINIKQGDDCWLRIRNMLDDINLGWSLDFIELVPVSILNNTDMHEDWY